MAKILCRIAVCGCSDFRKRFPVQKLAAQTCRSTGAQHTAGRPPVAAGEIERPGLRLLPSAGVTPTPAAPATCPLAYLRASHGGTAMAADGQGRRRRGDPMHSKGPVASTVVTVAGGPGSRLAHAAATAGVGPRAPRRDPGVIGRIRRGISRHPPAASKLIAVAVLARARVGGDVRVRTRRRRHSRSAEPVRWAQVTDRVGYCIEEKKSPRHVRQRLQSLSGYGAG